MAEQTKAYRLKDGVGKHFAEGRQVGAGEVVQLTASQAAGFKDKFEAVGEGFPVTGDVAGTNNTPEATKKDGQPGQNPELGQQESAAALKAVGDPNKAGEAKK